MCHDTLLNLFLDPNHWVFEIVVTILVDGILMGVVWTKLKAHYTHHLTHDRIHKDDK